MGNISLITLLVFISMSCAVGAFSKRFSANLLQRFGLAIFSLWSISCMKAIYLYNYKNPVMVMGIIALAVYSLGTIIKTCCYCYKEK